MKLSLTVQVATANKTKLNDKTNTQELNTMVNTLQGKMQV